MQCKIFPNAANNTRSSISNPAIQLFGNRFFIDQTPMEFIIEFLLIVVSQKSIGKELFESPLPELAILKNLNNDQLAYHPKSKLNLKLFSFLGASRLDSRHISHRLHYNELIDLLAMKINTSDPEKKFEIIRTLENLFLGFQGAGGGRTWCAQSFLPLSPGILCGESIWKEAQARKLSIDNWDVLLEQYESIFSTNQHVFFARGGEVLYLQLCNALNQPKETITQWALDNNLDFNIDELNPEWLRNQLNETLQDLMLQCPKTVTDIADFIDEGLEDTTSLKTDFRDLIPRSVTTGWCPSESWQEGYLFAIELLRLCKANLDMIDRIYLLETLCAMQVLRSLAMQSSRHVIQDNAVSFPGYRIAVTSAKEEESSIKRISQQSVKAIEKLIYMAIRSDSVELPKDEKDRGESLKEADKRYAGKLFISICKRIDFIIPKKGPGVRFVLNEHLLRYLVITTVPTGGRLTYDTFKQIVEIHHGMVFDGDGLFRRRRIRGRSAQQLRRLQGSSDDRALSRLGPGRLRPTRVRSGDVPHGPDRQQRRGCAAAEGAQGRGQAHPVVLPGAGRAQRPRSVCELSRRAGEGRHVHAVELFGRRRMRPLFRRPCAGTDAPQPQQHA